MPMRKLKNYKPTRFMAETSHYSKQMADFAVMFIEQLTHTKGQNDLTFQFSRRNISIYCRF